MPPEKTPEQRSVENARFAKRLSDAGITKLTVPVPVERIPELKAIDSRIAARGAAPAAERSAVSGPDPSNSRRVPHPRSAAAGIGLRDTADRFRLAHRP